MTAKWVNVVGISFDSSIVVTDRSADNIPRESLAYTDMRAKKKIKVPKTGDSFESCGMKFTWFEKQKEAVMWYLDNVSGYKTFKWNGADWYTLQHVDGRCDHGCCRITHATMISAHEWRKQQMCVVEEISDRVVNVMEEVRRREMGGIC